MYKKTSSEIAHDMYSFAQRYLIIKVVHGTGEQLMNATGKWEYE